MNEARCWSLGWQRAAFVLMLLALACDERAPTRRSGTDATDPADDSPGGEEPLLVFSSGEDRAEPTNHAAVSASWSPPELVTTAAAGSGAVAPIVAPYGISLVCGDAIVGATEECDDGPGAAQDACTADCKVRDQPVVALPPTRTVNSLDRYLGAGRHPVSGLTQGFATAFMEVGHADPEPTVAASLFNIWGQRTKHVNVSAGA